MKKSISLIMVILLFIVSMACTESAEEWFEMSPKAKNLNEEINCLKRSIVIDPRYVVAHYNLGVACEKLGRNEEAIEAFKKAIEIEPWLY